jgi:Raf kinase inhibitor-like YbhB/YbcL family protein
MRIMSSAFRNGDHIPQQYARDAEDKSPPLHIEGVPVTARSLVLIVDDPDAPQGTFTHWLLFDIDPKRIDIDEDHVPEEARQGTTDWGEAEYGGPQPPSGEHRYFFRLYALNTKLDLPNEATRRQVDTAMNGHVLTTAELMGRYAAAVAAATR